MTQLAVGSVTLKLGFPQGAEHLMKEFIQLESETPKQAGGSGAGSCRARGALAETSAFREGFCFHDVRGAELARPHVEGAAAPA